MTGNWIWYGDLDYFWDSVCSIAAGETRHIPLHMLLPWQARFWWGASDYFWEQCVQREKPDIFSCICSNRDRQLDLIRWFRLFLGQCMQHCSGREINPTPPSARYILSWKLSNDQWLFLGNTLVNVHCTVLALLWTIVKLWMRKLWLLMVRTNVLLNLFFKIKRMSELPSFEFLSKKVLQTHGTYQYRYVTSSFSNSWDLLVQVCY